MINATFVAELFELCQKHKQNIHVQMESNDTAVNHYEVDITGAWAVNKESNAVEVWEVPAHKNVMNLGGTTK